MGLKSQQTHPDVRAAVLRIFEAVRSAGKPFGINAFDHTVDDHYLAAGATFVLVGADVDILARGSEALAARFAGGDCRVRDDGAPPGMPISRRRHRRSGPSR